MPKKIEAPEGMGWCSKCKQFLPAANFWACRFRKSGLERYCNACRRDYTRKKYDQIALVIPPEGKLYCGHCKTIKDKSEFSPSQASPAKGRAYRNSGYCRQCVYNYAYKEEPKKRSERFGINHQSFKPYTGHLSTDALELAYCAGLFDAEGSFQMTNGRTATPFLSFSNNSEALLNRYHAILGGIIRYFERVASKGSVKGSTVSEGRVVINRLDHVAQASKALAPYLKLKRDRCEIMMEAATSGPQRRNDLRPLLDSLNEKCQRESLVYPPDKHLSLNDVKNISESDVAYLSGYVDGDGWIGIGWVALSGQLQINSSSSKFSILEHLYKIFGGAMRPGDSTEEQATVTLWAVTCANDMALSALLARMSKYLVLKKQHALYGVEIIKNRKRTKELVTQMRYLTWRAKMEKLYRVQRSASQGEVHRALSPLNAERGKDIESAAEYVRDFVMYRNMTAYTIHDKRGIDCRSCLEK